MTEETKFITLSELRKHSKEENMWITLHGDVYHFNLFTSHPGGQDILIINAGTDATSVFDDAEHSSTDKKQFKQYFISKLQGYKEETVQWFKIKDKIKQ